MSVTPRQITAEEGESVIFNCSIKGHPVHSVTWVKNLSPIVANSRIRYLSRDLLQVAPIMREDKGMYQCFVRNDFGMAQGTAELNLGGKRHYILKPVGYRLTFNFKITIFR